MKQIQLIDGNRFFMAVENSQTKINLNPEYEFDLAQKWEFEVEKNIATMNDVELLMYKEVFFKQEGKLMEVRNHEAYHRLITIDQRTKINHAIEKWSNCWMHITNEIEKRNRVNRDNHLNSILN